MIDSKELEMEYWEEKNKYRNADVDLYLNAEEERYVCSLNDELFFGVIDNDKKTVKKTLSELVKFENIIREETNKDICFFDVDLLVEKALINDSLNALFAIVDVLGFYSLDDEMFNLNNIDCKDFFANHPRQEFNFLSNFLKKNNLKIYSDLDKFDTFFSIFLKSSEQDRDSFDKLRSRFLSGIGGYKEDLKLLVLHSVNKGINPIEIIANRKITKETLYFDIVKLMHEEMENSFLSGLVSLVRNKEVKEVNALLKDLKINNKDSSIQCMIRKGLGDFNFGGINTVKTYFIPKIKEYIKIGLLDIENKDNQLMGGDIMESYTSSLINALKGKTAIKLLSDVKKTELIEFLEFGLQNNLNFEGFIKSISKDLNDGVFDNFESEKVFFNKLVLIGSQNKLETRTKKLKI